MDFALTLSKALSGDMTLSLEGFEVICRQSDGYVNATALCKAGGREYSTWKRSKETFLAELSSVLQICRTELVRTSQGGIPSHQGTWVHPQVAISIATWISPKFEVKVSRWIHELLVTGSVVHGRELHTAKVMEMQLEQMRGEVQAKEVEIFDLRATVARLEDMNKQLLGGMHGLQLEARDASRRLDLAREEIHDTHELVADLATRAVPIVSDKKVTEAFLLFRVRYTELDIPKEGYHVRCVQQRGIASAKSNVKTKYGEGNFELVKQWNCAPNSILLKQGIRESLRKVLKMNMNDITMLVPMREEDLVASIDDIYRDRY